MLLAVDIGNSTIKFGVYDGENLDAHFKIATLRTLNAAEVKAVSGANLDFSIHAVIISSVVPELNKAFQDFARQTFNLTAQFVDAKTPTNLKVLYNPPENLGADRYVAAFTAAEKYGVPVIVCDFGTAATIDYVNQKREFVGGIIAPGITTLSDALHFKTSKLPRIEITKPAAVIGDSTITAIQSGVFYGYLGLVENILRRMIDEIGEQPKIIATGGFAELIKQNCGLIETVDEFLMLDGLRRIHETFNL